MNIDSKLREIRRFCQANADEARVRKYARFFTEGYDAYGLEQQAMEKQCDLWMLEWKAELGLKGFLSLGERLLESGKYEEASFGLLFVIMLRSEYTPETFRRLGCWPERGFRNWAHTDVFCREALSHFLLKKTVTIEAMADWRASESKWQRRAVPVTLVEVVKAGWPVAGLLKYVSPMMLDPEKVVQQGLGWFLREAWKQDPAKTEAYLLEWKDRCPRLIIQYATEKMNAAQKAKFKKAASAASPRGRRKKQSD